MFSEETSAILYGEHDRGNKIRGGREEEADAVPPGPQHSQTGTGGQRWRRRGG